MEEEEVSPVSMIMKQGELATVDNLYERFTKLVNPVRKDIINLVNKLNEDNSYKSSYNV